MTHAKLTIMALVLLPLAGQAHDTQPQNDDGCHEDKRYNKYHCHTGVLKGRSFDNAEEAAKALITEAIRPKNQSSEGQVQEGVDPS